MPQSPQSSSTPRPLGRAAGVPGWKSPCTSVSGSRTPRPRRTDPAGRRRKACRAPPSRRRARAGPDDQVLHRRHERPGPPVRGADRRPARGAGRPSPAAAGRACRGPGAAPAGGRPSGPLRARRPGAPGGPSAAISGGTTAGPAGPACAPSCPKNGGTTVSQAGPSAVGSCQTLERFQVFTWMAGPGARPALQRGAVRRPRRDRGPGRRAGRRQPAAGRRPGGRPRRAGHGTSCNGGVPRPRRGRSTGPPAARSATGEAISRSTATPMPNRAGHRPRRAAASGHHGTSTSNGGSVPGRRPRSRRQSSSVTCRGRERSPAGMDSAAEQALGQPARDRVQPDPLLGMVSRSRTVTAWSSRVSKSTVTQNGVPISSWRR